MSTALAPKERFTKTIDRAAGHVTHHFGGDEEAALAFMTALRLAATENPKIMECTPTSIIRATLHCSRLRLVPNDGQDHIHLIPYGNELQAQLGFRGYIELGERSSKVASLDAGVVYEDEVRKGLFRATRAPFFVAHAVGDADRSDPSTLKYAYAYVTRTSGQIVGVILDRADIEKAKAKAKGVSRSDSPWSQWPERMWRKTAIKALFRSGKVPMSPVVREAMALEAEVEPAIEPDSSSPLPPLELPDVSDLEPHQLGD